MENKLGIAIAGTHGKTTTTAMIAWMLVCLNQQPSFIVGGILKNLETNAQAGKGLAFVIEADEYDRMFLGLSPRVVVITNIEFDHPDCYPTPEEYYQAFHDFTGRLPSDGTLLACADDEGTAKLLKEVTSDHFLALSYGFSAHADYQIQQAHSNLSGGFSFIASYREADSSLTFLAKVELQVPGVHNASNALAALATAHLLGLPVDEAAKALNSFPRYWTALRIARRSAWYHDR